MGTYPKSVPTSATLRKTREFQLRPRASHGCDSVGLRPCARERSYFQQVAYVFWPPDLGCDLANDAFSILGIDMSAQRNLAVESANLRVVGVLRKAGIGPHCGVNLSVHFHVGEAEPLGQWCIGAGSAIFNILPRIDSSVSRHLSILVGFLLEVLVRVIPEAAIVAIGPLETRLVPECL